MEALTIISALISLITLIVFFIMAINIGRIKKILEDNFSKGSGDYIPVFNAGELKEYLGKNQEALDCYMEAYYLISKCSEENAKTPNVRRHKETVLKKIKLLGGEVKPMPK